MKILLVHNDYAKPSGEEAVVDKMDVIFRSLGCEVVQFRMSTAGLRDSLAGKAKGFIAGIYSPEGVRAMAEALDRHRPDMVNVHNLYPFISPAALRECRKRGVAVIMTVHNYRLMCPTGLFMRNNMPCELCLQKGNEWSCVKYNCEGSALKSIGYAARNAVARLRRHYIDCVDYFACLTEFQRSKLIEAGFPPSKLLVIPNPGPSPSSSLSLHPSLEGESRGGEYIAYSGRISREKGVDIIMEVARHHPEIPFKLAGAVRDKELVENLPSNVQLMGFLSGDELQDFTRDASFFVMASKWYEGFPMTVLETAQYSKPMIGPAHGGFPEIIDKELLFIPGDADSLEERILSLWNNPERIAHYGNLAFRNLQEKYSLTAVTKLWKELINPYNPTRPDLSKEKLSSQ